MLGFLENQCISFSDVAKRIPRFILSVSSGLEKTVLPEKGEEMC